MWKRFSAQAILSVCAIVITFVSCGTKTIDKWAGKIYVYVSNDLAFERKQDNEVIPYNSQNANGMFCMTREDFLDFLNTYVIKPKVSSPKDGS